MKFEVTCKPSQTAQVDPIVEPGNPMSGHLHTFFGGHPVTENTTPDDLRGGPTTCKVADDTSAYWVPALYRSDTGERVPTSKVFAYYFGVKGVPVEPFPAGAEIVGGNSHATAIQGKRVISWSCGNGGNKPVRSPVREAPYDCGDPQFHVLNSTGVAAAINFPNCWDGALSVGNDTAHFAYSPQKTGPCPAGFPHRMPTVSLHVHYSNVAGTGDFQRGDLVTLASGPHFTEHADFMNAWNQARLESLTANCLNAFKDCGFLTQ